MSGGVQGAVLGGLGGLVGNEGESASYNIEADTTLRAGTYACISAANPSNPD
jgi:hypothetical protein